MAHEIFHFDSSLVRLAQEAEEQARDVFRAVDGRAEQNQWKVLSAFHSHRVSEQYFYGSTGYGYGDRGRDSLDGIYAELFGTEDALVRHNFVSGTHALTTALFGVLRPGDTMVSITGAPYDTLEEVIGITGNGSGSLREFGIQYKQVDLLPDGSPDYPAIREAVKGARMAYLQRSRGYSLRPSLTVDVIGKIIEAVREGNPQAVVMVDNCYGEFVEDREPTHVGADLAAGSLIKNPGGGIAQTGGYIVGREKLVEQCACRLTAPGMGKEVGCSLDQSRNMYMGLFFAPTVVASAVKTAIFAAKLFGALGYGVFPAFDEERTDIIQAIQLGSAQRLKAFCQGIQKGSPVDSFVTPEPWDMPGYQDQVIMAAGAFTMGASIELSADAPLRDPFAVWMQGGLTYPSGKAGVLLAAQSMLDQGLLKPKQ